MIVFYSLDIKNSIVLVDTSFSLS